jgi:acetolactate synthase small subunit
MSVAPSEAPTPAPEPAFRYTVTAHFEPSVLSRVVELFVLRDLIPYDLHCRQVGDDGLRIDLGVRGMTPEQADHVATRIRQFPTVLSVLLRG